MANILAAANGNFNATSTWIGGVVPTSGDTAYLNNRTITITADITCDKISNLAENGATAGGSCNLTLNSSDNRTITSNLDSTTSNLLNISENTAGGLVTLNGVFRNFTSRTININTTNPSTRVVINGNAYAGSAFNNGCIYVSGSGTTTINGDLYGPGQHPGGGGPLGQSSALASQSSAVITINGNCYPGANSNSGSIGIFSNSNSLTFSMTLNGSILSSGFSNQSVGIGISQSPTGGTLIINGNVTGSSGAFNPNTGAGSGINLAAGTGSFNLTIDGDCVASTGSPALFVSGTSGTVTVKKAIGNNYGAGSIWIGAPVEAIVNISQALIYVKELESGSRGVSPFRGAVLVQNLNSNTVKLATSSSTYKNFVDPSSVVTPPAVTDVRSGVTYNAGNLTGTCAVPAANSVAAGVAVDNTVGTAVLTQANVWGYSLSSASSVAGSVGEKLKKTAIPADIIALS